MNEIEYEEEKAIFLNNLKTMADKGKEIERETVDQTNSMKWFELRRNILTASNFSLHYFITSGYRMRKCFKKFALLFEF